MHKARAFFLVCAGVFLLALVYHFGARNATAQAQSPVSGWTAVPFGSDNFAVVMTSNGDMFAREMWGAPPALIPIPVTSIGNFWTGSVTPATRSTWGHLKSRYLPGAPTPPQDK